MGEVDVPVDAGLVLFYMSVEYAFTELCMDRLETSIFKSNKYAMKIDKFLGYKEIVGSEKMIIKNGKEEPAIRIFMTKDDWSVRRQEIYIG